MYAIMLGFGTTFSETPVRAGMFAIHRVPLNDASAEIVLKNGGVLVIATGEIAPSIYEACRRVVAARMVSK